MPLDDFSHVRVWVFDLDNTLYPPEMRLFDQIEARMTEWVSETAGVSRDEANRLRDNYWARYGTTLSGLMEEHGMEPEAYLTDVHDIDFGILAPDPELAAAIRNLPGRKVVYTNGTATYAERVTEARGLAGLFDGLYGVEDAAYRPKPERAAFETVFARAAIDPMEGAMFEDMARNLVAPHALGMRTVHVHAEPDEADHIHYGTDDLTRFLRRLTDTEARA